MGRIKPQALLIQSKKKKGPAKISLRAIITCNLVLIVVVLSLYAAYKHWYQRSVSSMASSFDQESFQGDPRSLSEANRPGHHGRVILNTSEGSITVELSQDASSEVVDKFIELCKKGYFNGMNFHRVIKHYVLQGGDIHDLGTVEDWKSKAKSHIQPATLPRHEAFMLGTSKVKRDSSSFPIFITTSPISELNENLTVFGHVIKGQDVVQAIEEVDTDEHYRPISPVSLLGVTLKLF